MKILKNFLLTGSLSKPIATDIFYNDDGIAKPVVIYAHGFNGLRTGGISISSQNNLQQQDLLLSNSISHIMARQQRTRKNLPTWKRMATTTTQKNWMTFNR
jgi:hypothetical protein